MLSTKPSDNNCNSIFMWEPSDLHEFKYAKFTFTDSQVVLFFFATSTLLILQLYCTNLHISQIYLSCHINTVKTRIIKQIGKMIYFFILYKGFITNKVFLTHCSTLYLKHMDIIITKHTLQMAPHHIFVEEADTYVK